MHPHPSVQLLDGRDGRTGPVHPVAVSTGRSQGERSIQQLDGRARRIPFKARFREGKDGATVPV